MVQQDTVEAETVDEVSIPLELPVLPSRETVIFPYVIVPMAVEGENWVKLIDDAVLSDKMIALFTLKEADGGVTLGNINEIGTAAAIARMIRLPDGSVQVLLQGMSRIVRRDAIQAEPYIKVRVEPLRDIQQPSLELQALRRTVADQFQKAVSLAPNLPPELGMAVENIQDPARLADFVAANSSISTKEKQELLETLDVAERLKKASAFLSRELEILEIGSKIQSQIKSQMDKAQRDYYIRAQLKALQKELGEDDERTSEINELRERLNAAQLPEEAMTEADRELERLAKMPPGAAEYTVSRTYLDWLIALPWAKSTEDRLDVNDAQRILDEDHFDLEKVKERILEYLAVRKIKQDTRGPILCFVGPPGVGKTSLGQSIARSMGRRFIRISLGGVRDEADIRGHRRTYVGALPGRISHAMRRVESSNPVFMLDEVDKLGADFRGDPASALLEVLDPAQNFSFVDHYLDVAFDLSKVMFIATANVLDTIPPPLRDRMEVIYISGYTEPQKLEIAKRYLVQRQLNEHGLTAEVVQFADEGLVEVIRNYTRESGVRNLEREIATICRKVARKWAQSSGPWEKDSPLAGLQVVVDGAGVAEFLGPARFHWDVAEKADEIGVATGLAWTEVGGDVLFIEASVVPGRGSLLLTGKLGEVMQESARAALTYARSRAKSLGIPQNFYEKKDIHIHVPAGAIPKDGPSAGITMATALVSALSKRPVNKDVAMTGEITLRGKVLPIGGVREKVLAAHRAGARTIILPKDNRKDIDEVPPEVREDIKFIFAEHVDEVLSAALKPKQVREMLAAPN
ncbi:MAG: endopeptidase La [Chloroflexi bacterium]|nr:endopeptidase La [Chloroflexota bacterium]